MRYFVITYVTKPNGQIDEQTQVSRNLKNRDLQTGSVILDFKELKVVKASLNGTIVPKDFNKIVQYYYQHYKNIFDRLFTENNWKIEIQNDDTENTNVQEANPS